MTVAGSSFYKDENGDDDDFLDDSEEPTLDEVDEGLGESFEDDPFEDDEEEIQKEDPEQYGLVDDDFEDEDDILGDPDE